MHSVFNKLRFQTVHPQDCLCDTHFTTNFVRTLPAYPGGARE